MLLQAQHLSERSTCKRCGTYGQYRLVGATAKSMSVICRNCDAEWTIQ
jgi:transcription elongation factor Elf1